MSNKNTEAKSSKGKKALNIALIVVQVLIVIVAIAFSISILLSTGYESNTDFGKSSIRLMPVLTDSMNGDKSDSFKAGDLIIVKSAEKVNVDELEVGDIVTYLDYVGADLQFVTHRIVDKSITTLADGSQVAVFETMGDAETSGITKTLYSGDIKGVYVGKLAGVGSAVFWLQDPTHFFLVIMLPLILLLLYNAYLVVRMVIEYKLKKQKEQLAVATTQGSAPLDEEEIKRRAIEEYLKSQGISPVAAEEKPQESATPVDEENKTADDADGAPVEEKKDETAIAEIIAEKPAEDKAEETAAEKSEEEKQEAPAAEDTAQTETPEEAPAEQAVQAEEQTDATEQTADVVVEETEKPAKKTAAKKSAAKATEKKPAAKKSTAKTTAKTAEKKPAAKTAKPAAAKKPAAKTAKPAAAKKPAAKKTTKKISE